MVTTITSGHARKTSTRGLFFAIPGVVPSRETVEFRESQREHSHSDFASTDLMLAMAEQCPVELVEHRWMVYE